MELNVHLRPTDGESLADSTRYRHLVGSLVYLGVTRPNISYPVYILSQFVCTPTQLHYSHLLHVLRYLGGTISRRLFFPRSSSLQLQAYSDATWASDPSDRWSLSAYCVFLGGSLIDWKTKKQTAVSRSSAEAELRAMALLTAEVTWLRWLLEDFDVSVSAPTPLLSDNTGAISIAKDPVKHELTKHIGVDASYMRTQINPMVIMYSKRKDGALEEIGRTEVISNCLNPSWNTKINLQYQFEVLQPLVFQVYDIDPQLPDVSEMMLKLEEQQFLGEAICVLSEVVTRQNRLLTLKLGVSEHNLPNPSKFGELTVQAEESAGSKAIMEMVFRCSDLEIKDLLSKSDPFLLISRISESGASVPICKTEVRKNDLNPKWKPVILNLQQIGSKENLLIIECFNFSSNGKHDLVGKIVKSVAELENMYHSQNGENFFVPASFAHECRSKEVLKSQLYVEKYLENNRHTFLDYISAGCQLNFMVAIDFTASNGNPRLPDSLHYIDPSGRPNAYQRAILEIGDVLQYYDPAKRFPSWGFGARPIDGPVSHCFNLNGSTYQPEVEGIQGIMSAYISALRNVSLAGPTLFGPVISTATAIASQSLTSNQQKYFILLIATDGVVTDFQETIDAIIKASDFPLSIIVVGVGGADFKEMEFLDPNKGERLESSTGRVASRDMIQFAPMKDVLGTGISTVQSLLAEIPGQFMTYMRTREIQAIS